MKIFGIGLLIFIGSFIFFSLLLRKDEASRLRDDLEQVKWCEEQRRKRTDK